MAAGMGVGGGLGRGKLTEGVVIRLRDARFSP